MSAIHFFLKVAPREPFVGLEELNMLLGGLRIVINDTIVTQYSDDEEDPGFRGGLIYYILLGCLGCIPRLFAGERCKIDLIDGVGYFIFTPQGNLTYVKNFDFDPDRDLSDCVIRIVKNGKQIVVSCDSQNRRYPDFPLGSVVPTMLLAKEIIKVSEEFLRHLESMKQSPDEYIDKFRALLDEKKDYLNGYLNFHPEIEI